MRIIYLNNIPDLTRDQLALESEPMANPKLLTEPKSIELLDRLAPNWVIACFTARPTPSSTSWLKPTLDRTRKERMKTGAKRWATRPPSVPCLIACCTTGTRSTAVRSWRTKADLPPQEAAG
jgi:hypothetical protein